MHESLYYKLCELSKLTQCIKVKWGLLFHKATHMQNHKFNDHLYGSLDEI
jgi:hypothetical protein